MAVRPLFRFSDGRSVHAGTAFAPRSARPLVLVPSHVILALLHQSTLQGFELENAVSKQTLMKGEGLAIPAGAPMNGFDFSTDFVVVSVDQVPDGIARLELTPDRPKIGDLVDVIACPFQGDQPEATLQATVSYASSTRLEIQVNVTSATRGMSGAPIVSRATGRVVGVLQAIAEASSGIVLARATPAEAIIPRLAEAERATTKTLPLASWSTM